MLVLTLQPFKSWLFHSVRWSSKRNRKQRTIGLLLSDHTMTVFNRKIAACQMDAAGAFEKTYVRERNVSWTFSNSLYPSQKGKQHRLAVSFDFIGAFSGRVASHQVEQPRYGRVLIRGQIMGSLWCWMIMPVYETFQLFILDSRAWSCRNWWIASQCTHVEGSWGTCWWSKMILSSMGISSIFRRIHMNCMNWYMFTFHPVTLWQPFQHSQLKTSPWENPPIDCEWHDVVACAVCAGSMSCGSSSSPKS